MSLSSRRHGANPEKLYQSMRIPMPDHVIDFSTNTNVVPWGGDLGIDWKRCLAGYPDDEATELRELIAEREKCDPDNVLIVNGSNEAVYLLASLLSGQPTAVLQPVYGEYRRALEAYDSPVRNIFSEEELSARLQAVFVCNPCNPTGAYLEPEKIVGWAKRFSRTLFVVDEAYLDFLRGDENRAESWPVCENVVRVRSLTKIFHLCGVRIGYVLAPKRHIELLKRRQPTWSVNGPAQQAALAYMQDREFVRESRFFYERETLRFIAAIESAGYAVRPTRTHFFLVDVENDEALIRYLLKEGIVVRHTRNFPGLDGCCVRIATRLPEENALCVRALRRFREISGRGV